MIYESKHNNKIQQGDILKKIPYFGVLSNQMQQNWIKEATNISESFEYEFDAPIGVKCILLTQNCDIRRNRNLIFARISRIKDLSTKMKGRLKKIYELVRNETRSHYLPQSNDVEDLSIPHVIDFKDIFVIPADFVLDNLDLFFVARMKLPAVKIFQEKITRFFTRLAYDEEILYSDDELKFKIDKNDIKLENVKIALASVDRSYDSQE